MEGYGEFYMNDGKKYFGFFKGDKREGFGIYYWPENKFYIGFWKEGKQHGLGKYIENSKIKYGLWNFGKKQKFFDNEDDFLDNLGDNEEKCASFFKWDINKVKQFMYFEGYDKKESDEDSDSFENIINKNNKNNERENIKKNLQNKKKTSEDEEEDESNNDNLL